MKNDIYQFFFMVGPWGKLDLIRQLELVSGTRFAEKVMDWDYYVEKYRAMFIEEHGFDPVVEGVGDCED